MGLSRRRGRWDKHGIEVLSGFSEALYQEQGSVFFVTKRFKSALASVYNWRHFLGFMLRVFSNVAYPFLSSFVFNFNIVFPDILPVTTYVPTTPTLPLAPDSQSS